MNGMSLYALYEQANAELDIGVDSYGQMDDLDQEIWSVFAGKLNEDDPRVELAAVCAKFIREHEIRCPEDIYQSDRISAALPDLVEELCEVLGYYEDAF